MQLSELKRPTITYQLGHGAVVLGGALVLAVVLAPSSRNNQSALSAGLFGDEPLAVDFYLLPVVPPLDFDVRVVHVALERGALAFCGSLRLERNDERVPGLLDVHLAFAIDLVVNPGRPLCLVDLFHVLDGQCEAPRRVFLELIATIASVF